MSDKQIDSYYANLQETVDSHQLRIASMNEEIVLLNHQISIYEQKIKHSKRIVAQLEKIINGE